MRAFVWPFLYLFLVWQNSWARQGMTIDKLECIGNPSMCSSTHCTLLIDANDPLITDFSFDCNMTKSCSSVFVRVKSYSKTKTTYTLSFEVKLDVCGVMAGAKHPIIKTFLGPDIYDNLEKYKLACPWSAGVFQVANFSIDGSKRGNFALKRTGRYLAELEFTCGQNQQLFTLKFYGKRSMKIAD